MLARLRREFVAILMLVGGLILVFMLGGSLASAYAAQYAATDALLDRVLDLRFDTPEIGDTSGEQTADAMLTVVVDVSADGSVAGLARGELEVSPDTLYDVINEALLSSDDAGHSASYPISWHRKRLDSGWRVALVDTYTRDLTLRTQTTNSVVLFVIAMSVLFAASWALSGWMLRPVQRAWDDQRRFVSDASHELKTPLSVIIANTDILRGEKDLPDEARRWVESTSEEASHMRRLVDDLLTLARADERDATGAHGPVEHVNLSKLVSGCALEFDAVAFERGCSIACDLEEDVFVDAVPDELVRVLGTLLDNATKYATHGTTVDVRLAKDARHVVLSVRNRGEVIGPDDLEHLFDRFYRTDEARERSAQGGFGLGLAIAKSLVEGMGGKISVSSTEGEGTTFTVTL